MTRETMHLPTTRETIFLPGYLFDGGLLPLFKNWIGIFLFLWTTAPFCFRKRFVKPEKLTFLKEPRSFDGRKRLLQNFDRYFNLAFESGRHGL